MSDVQKLSLNVLRCVSEFLALLPDDQLNDLAAGKARLALIPKDSDEPLQTITPQARRRGPGATKAEPTVAMSATVETLATMTTREEARALLSPLIKPQLKDLANLLGMRGVSRLRNEGLVDAIIEFTVGNRLNSGAIRQL